jgi:hypothetical protein
MTPSGIDPATFRFVAQCLNHCAISLVPTEGLENKIKRFSQAEFDPESSRFE